MFTAYGDWVEMLRDLYAGHSFPLSWSIWKYLKAAMVVALFLYSWKMKPADRLHTVIKLGTFSIFGLWLLGLIFTEFLPLPIFIQLQLFRSYTWLSLFAVIYWSNFLVCGLNSSWSWWKKIVLLLATIGLIIMLPSEGNPIINSIHRSPEVLWKNNYLLIILLGFIAIAYYHRFKTPLSNRLYATVLLILLILYTGKEIVKNGVSLESQLPGNWVDIQHWARNNTNTSDMFIVPPDMRGFRIDGERTILGDYKDGIQMYFNPEFGYQWLDRMKLLGNDPDVKEAGLKTAYANLNGQHIASIADEFKQSHPAIYLVSYANDGHYDFIKVYENKEFVVYKVP
jgi:hypothetical protein